MVNLVFFILCGLQNICGSFVGTFVFWQLSLENKKNANVFILTGGGFSHFHMVLLY